MNGAAALVRPVAVADDPAALACIARADIELAIWRRPSPPELDWLAALDGDDIDDLDFEATVAALDAEVADGLAQAGYPADERGGALAREVAMLARRTAAALGCERLRLRLELIDTDACPRFHADHVVARLLATLTGPATQWIETATPGVIHQLAAGDVAIFKGRRLVDAPTILHRSPPVAHTGDTRLLLAIDAIEAEPATGTPGAALLRERR